MKIKYNTKSWIIILVTVLLLITVLSTSYAVFTVRNVGKKTYLLTVGTLDFKISNEDNSIRLFNAYPMSDSDGKQLTPYVFTLTNTGTLKEYYKVSLVLDEEKRNDCTDCEFLDSNKIRFSLSIDGTNNSVRTLSDNTVLDVGSLEKGEERNYKLNLWLGEDATIEEENKYYYGKIKVEASQEEYIEGMPASEKMNLVDKVDTTTNIKFSDISSLTNGRGVYSYQENGKDIYYFRGNVLDNHVIFAGYCWKVVRTTSTGGIKMIYDGEVVDGTCSNTGKDSSIGSSSFNSKANDNAYVGYMYGLVGLTEDLDVRVCLRLNPDGVTIDEEIDASDSECILSGGKMVESAYEATHANILDSSIKTMIDTWFSSSNLNTKENLQKIEDSVYCNDRSIVSSSLGYGTNSTDYMTKSRVNASEPSLECVNLNDRFTVSSANGNGKLTYPVGLLTTDEVILAGGGDFDCLNDDYYLYTEYYFWTMSPSSYSKTSGLKMFQVDDDGDLDPSYANYSWTVRPVITLSSDVEFLFNGDGTWNNPYIVK